MRRRCLDDHKGDSGSAATSAAIVMGALVFAIAGIVQAALYYHGVQRAEAAADRAVTAAAAQGGTPQAGETAAQEFLAGAPIDEAAIIVRREADETTATVTGTAPHLIPITWRISASAQAPTETFVPETRRP